MNWMGGARSLHTKNDGSRRRQQRHFKKIKNQMRSGNIPSSQQSESDWRPSFLAAGDPRLRKDEAVIESESSEFERRWAYNHTEVEKPARTLSITGIPGFARHESEPLITKLKGDKSKKLSVIKAVVHRNSVKRPVNSSQNKTGTPKSSSPQISVCSSKQKRQTTLGEFHMLAPVVNRLKDIGKPNLENPERTNARKAGQIKTSQLERHHTESKASEWQKCRHQADSGCHKETIPHIGIDDFEFDDKDQRVDKIDSYHMNEPKLETSLESFVVNDDKGRNDGVDFEERKKLLLAQPDWAGLRFTKPVKMEFPNLRRAGFSKVSRFGRESNPETGHSIEIKANGAPLLHGKRTFVEDDPVMVGALPATQSVIKIKIGENALNSTQQTLEDGNRHSRSRSNDTMLLDTLLQTPHSSSSFDLFETEAQRKFSKLPDQQRDRHPRDCVQSISSTALLSGNEEIQLRRLPQTWPRNLEFGQQDLVLSYLVPKNVDNKPQKQDDRLIFTDTPSMIYRPPVFRPDSRQELPSLEAKHWSKRQRITINDMEVENSIQNTLGNRNLHSRHVEQDTASVLPPEAGLSRPPELAQTITNTLNTQRRTDDQEQPENFAAWYNFIGVGQDDFMEDAEFNLPKNGLGSMRESDSSERRDNISLSLRDYPFNRHGDPQSNEPSLNYSLQPLLSPNRSSFSSIHRIKMQDYTKSAKAAAHRSRSREPGQACQVLTPQTSLVGETGRLIPSSSMQPFRPQHPLVNNTSPTVQPGLVTFQRRSEKEHGANRTTGRT